MWYHREVRVNLHAWAYKIDVDVELTNAGKLVVSHYSTRGGKAYISPHRFFGRGCAKHQAPQNLARMAVSQRAGHCQAEHSVVATFLRLRRQLGQERESCTRGFWEEMHALRKASRGYVTGVDAGKKCKSCVKLSRVISNVAHSQ